MVDKLARFVKASMKGWDWAVANPDDAAMIVLDNDATGAQTEKHQKRMMGEIAKLVGTNPKGTGWLDPAAYDRTVKILLSGKSAPVITKAPEGAWTHDIFNKAAAMPIAAQAMVGDGEGGREAPFLLVLIKRLQADTIIAIVERQYFPAQFGTRMSRFFKLAIGCLIFAGMAVPAKAENPPLYVWADSLTLYAAPNFSSSVVGELAYGTQVERLAPLGPLMSGGGVYPALQGNEPALLAKTPSGPQLHGFRPPRTLAETPQQGRAGAGGICLRYLSCTAAGAPLRAGSVVLRDHDGFGLVNLPGQRKALRFRR